MRACMCVCVCMFVDELYPTAANCNNSVIHISFIIIIIIIIVVVAQLLSSFVVVRSLLWAEIRADKMRRKIRRNLPSINAYLRDGRTHSHTVEARGGPPSNIRPREPWGNISEVRRLAGNAGSQFALVRGGPLAVTFFFCA